MTQQKKRRLSREDWILAGFRALVRSGPPALKAEPLARELKTTKGSFYWHFKDVADFEDAMLAYWRFRATQQVIATVSQASVSPQEDLHILINLVTGFRDDAYGGLGAESAIRLWASTNPIVAKASREVDAARLDYLTDRFAHAGFSVTQALLFGQIMYGALVGLEYLELQNLGKAREGLTGLLDSLLSTDRI